MRTNGGTRGRLRRVLILAIGLAAMITAAPAATAAPVRIQAEYAPLASIKYLEPGTPAPRFANGEWII